MLQFQFIEEGRRGFTEPRQMGAGHRHPRPHSPAPGFRPELLRTPGQIQHMGAPVASEQFI